LIKKADAVFSWHQLLFNLNQSYLSFYTNSSDKPSTLFEDLLYGTASMSSSSVFVLFLRHNVFQLNTLLEIANGE